MTHNEQDVERVAKALYAGGYARSTGAARVVARAALDAMGLPSREQVAEIVQGASCRMETEHADWELGTKAFTWCDVHNSDAQSENPNDYGEVCPKALETADAILALYPAAPVRTVKGYSPTTVESSPRTVGSVEERLASLEAQCRDWHPLTPAPEREVVTVEGVEQLLVREWHQDQCACREFDGVDIDTCYTRVEMVKKYGGTGGVMMPPMTWTVEAVLGAAGINQEAAR